MCFQRQLNLGLLVECMYLPFCNRPKKSSDFRVVFIEKELRRLLRPPYSFVFFYKIEYTIKVFAIVELRIKVKLRRNIHQQSLFRINYSPEDVITEILKDVVDRIHWWDKQYSWFVQKLHQSIQN